MRRTYSVLSIARRHAVIFAALVASAQAARADEWTGQDKQMHFAAGAVIAAAGSVAYGQRTGFLIGTAAGVAKELVDSQRTGHVVSAKDALATAAGAWVGSYVPGLVLGRRFVGIRVKF